jgi:hypothetical protein
MIVAFCSPIHAEMTVSLNFNDKVGITKDAVLGFGATATGGCEPYEYEWSIENGTPGSVARSSSSYSGAITFGSLADGKENSVTVTVYDKNGNSKSKTIKVGVLQIEITTPNDLWYFDGTTPQNYPVKADFSAKVLAPSGWDGNFNWSISSGSSNIAFDGQANNRKDVKIKSIGKSTSLGDCMLRATHVQYSQAYLDSEVFETEWIKDSTKGSTSGSNYNFFGHTGWQCQIPYTMNPNFGTSMSNSIEGNEDWGQGYSHHTSPCTWQQAPAGSSSGWPAPTITDNIIPPMTATPLPKAYNSASTSYDVDSWPGQWRVGSASHGSGTTIMNATWVRKIDKGEHR